MSTCLTCGGPAEPTLRACACGCGITVHGFRAAESVPAGREPVELNVDECEPDGEAFGFGVSVHVERMDTGLWWMRIERAGSPALVGHFRSKSKIHALWEWEPER